jgi:hypothetical protein
MERTEAMTRATAPGQVLDGSYIDWAAVIGGGVVAVAVGSVFAGFGAALGLSTISAEPGEGSFNAMVIVSGVWIVVSLVVSYMTGGYIAGRMRRRIDAATADEVTVRDGVNGLIVWGLGIIVSVFLLGAAASTTVSAVGTAAETAGNVVGGVAEGTLAAAGSLVPEAVREDPMAYVSDTMLRPASVTPETAGGDDLARQTTAILANVMATGEISEAERGYLASAVTATTGAPPAEATARVEEAVSAAQAARAEAERLAAEAEETAIEAAEVARISAILTAFILAAAALVAAAAAYIGAVRGGRHRDEGRIFGGFAYRG